MLNEMKSVGKLMHTRSQVFPFFRFILYQIFICAIPENIPCHEKVQQIISPNLRKKAGAWIPVSIFLHVDEFDFQELRIKVQSLYQVFDSTLINLALYQKLN